MSSVAKWRDERPLERWDLFHCPAGVDHAIVSHSKPLWPYIVAIVGLGLP